jgi:hypothetical protein
MTDVRGKVLRAGDVGHLAIFFLQHVVAALLHDAALDGLAGHFRTVCAALRGSLILSNTSAGWGASAGLITSADAGALAAAGRAATRATTHSGAGSRATTCSAALGHSR